MSFLICSLELIDELQLKKFFKIIPDIEEGFEIISYNFMLLAIPSIYYNHCCQSGLVNQHTPVHNAK
jgi:hypothetical protein